MSIFDLYWPICFPLVRITPYFPESYDKVRVDDCKRQADTVRACNSMA